MKTDTILIDAIFFFFDLANKYHTCNQLLNQFLINLIKCAKNSANCIFTEYQLCIISENTFHYFDIGMKIVK